MKQSKIYNYRKKKENKTNRMTRASSAFNPVNVEKVVEIEKRKLDSIDYKDLLKEVQNERYEKKTKMESFNKDQVPLLILDNEDNSSNNLHRGMEEKQIDRTQSNLIKFSSTTEHVLQAALHKENQMSRTASTPAFRSPSSFSVSLTENSVDDLKATEKGNKLYENEQDQIEDNHNKIDSEIAKNDRSKSILKFEHVTSCGQKIQVRQGDITEEDTDAIVNAANEYLAHGGGVAGAVSRTGGPTIQKESNQWVKKYGRVKTGNVAVTRAGYMICRCVIHAVGPVWNGGKSNEENLLALSVKNSLKKADELKLKSIALPAISSGIFGFPKDLCAKIMFSNVIAFCAKHPDTSLKEIRFTNFDYLTVNIFGTEFTKIFGINR